MLAVGAVAAVWVMLASMLDPIRSWRRSTGSAALTRAECLLSAARVLSGGRRMFVELSGYDREDLPSWLEQRLLELDDAVQHSIDRLLPLRPSLAALAVCPPATEGTTKRRMSRDWVRQTKLVVSISKEPSHAKRSVPRKSPRPLSVFGPDGARMGL